MIRSLAFVTVLAFGAGGGGCHPPLTYDWTEVDRLMAAKVREIPVPGTALVVRHRGTTPPTTRLRR